MCWTLLGRPINYYNLLIVLTVIQDIITFNEVLFLTLSLTATMMLCVDLILMIKHPFKQKEPRMKIYIWISVSVSWVLAFFYLFKPDTFNSYEFFSFIAIYVGFLIAAVWSSLFSWKRLTLPGMSSEVRSLILKRHLASIAVYFICNLYVLASSIYNIKHFKGTGVDTWWAKTLKILYCS